MYRFKLKEALPFISNPDLREGHVLNREGIWTIASIVAHQFYRQNIRRKEYDQIVAANVLSKEESQKEDFNITAAWLQNQGKPNG